MKPVDLIINQLNAFVERFPEISFLYEFDEYEQIHIVEVRPLKAYEENLDYKGAEGEFTYEFDRRFSPDTILFVSEDSLIRVINPSHVFESSQTVFLQIEPQTTTL